MIFKRLHNTGTAAKYEMISNIKLGLVKNNFFHSFVAIACVIK